MKRYEEVSIISRKLKLLARDLRIPLVANAQLNRGPENRSDHRPRLADLRDAGTLEQDADVVIFLYRLEDETNHKAPSDDQEIGAVVEKQRNGPCGEVKLLFKKKYMRFENWSPGIPE